MEGPTQPLCACPHVQVVAVAGTLLMCLPIHSSIQVVAVAVAEAMHLFIDYMVHGASRWH